MCLHVCVCAVAGLMDTCVEQLNQSQAQLQLESVRPGRAAPRRKVRRAGGLEGWRAGGLEGWRAGGLEGCRAASTWQHSLTTTDTGTNRNVPEESSTRPCLSFELGIYVLGGLTDVYSL